MMTARCFLVITALTLLALAGCTEPSAPKITTLHPDANPMPSTDPLWSPQPHRDRPRQACVLPDGSRAYVMLAGIEDDPGQNIAVVDLNAAKTTERIHTPGAPWDCALSPSGRWLVVTLRFSDAALVIDTRDNTIAHRVAVPFYTEHTLFSPSGTRVFFANRWKDSVLYWDVQDGEQFSVLATSYQGANSWEPMGIPVADNPTTMAITADGKRLFVGSAAGLTIAVIDAVTGRLIDTDSDPTTTTVGAPKGINHIDFHSPVGGLAIHDGLLFVADVGTGTGSHPTEGRDLDGDGKPGDGTANVVFQDLGNELAVVDAVTFAPLHRYIADTTCCQDYRDVDPDVPERGLLIPAPDTWQPDVAPLLPPKSTWIVAGALPQAMAVLDGVLWVAYAGSNEVQGFAIGPTGTLTPKQTAGGLLRTGYNPVALKVAGARLLTVDRLAEQISLLDPQVDPRKTSPTATSGTAIVVGDVADGPFPSTDNELGEAINEMTAAFTIDGDQTCTHCHRDNGSIARPIVMPLQQNRLWGARNIMAQRGLYDTRPWFHESSMDETNFFPVLNEFARKENFCCEEQDATVWSKYPGVDACVADPKLKGCDHVLSCSANPPPECAQRPYAKGVELTRAAFIRARSSLLFGREKTFGDALYQERFDGTREPIPLDFEGITRAIGLFMLRTPRLLPNPNKHLNLPTAKRGKVLYEQTSVGCVGCHPLPATTTASLPLPFSPFGMPVRFPPVISPTRAPDGADASLVAPRFIGTFPLTVQGPAGVFFGATPLRGLWDRPSTRFLHDGRARSLREALATPGHDALRPGELGHNERDGAFDTHGSTSQLDRYELADLINFLQTL